MYDELSQDEMLLEIDQIRSHVVYLYDQELLAQKEFSDILTKINKYQDNIRTLKKNLKFIKKEAKVVSINEFANIAESLHANQTMLRSMLERQKCTASLIEDIKSQIEVATDKIQSIENSLNGRGIVVQL